MTDEMVPWRPLSERTPFEQWYLSLPTMAQVTPMVHPEQDRLMGLFPADLISDPRPRWKKPPHQDEVFAEKLLEATAGGFYP